MKRRELLKTLSVAPVVALAPSTAFAAMPEKKSAQPSNLLSETEGMGKTLGYKNDATQSEKRSDKKAICGSCNKWNKCHFEEKNTCKPGKADAAYAPCEMFKGVVVARKGWCSIYAQG